MPYQNLREEEIKNKFASDYFAGFDTTKIIGNVDFCITNQTQSLLWAEAKKGKSNIYHSFVQLILTIGKAKTFDKESPPPFLGAFDGYQIAFLPYSDIQEFFYTNDFNWNVTPSNYDTKEFKLLLDKVKDILQTNSLIFGFDDDHDAILDFIKINFVAGNLGISKIQIDKNNFLTIYNKWAKEVKPTIIAPWELAKKSGIIDADFYLADILSSNNQSLKDSLYVLLKDDHYELDKKLDEMGFFTSRRTNFNDNQKAHQQFWNKYQRPPRQEYWDYITSRRDMLVPQDVRERKGSFFTPSVWVEKSQQYLTAVLGEDWQDDYYIWDCAAGTGNLLAGLTNKYKIFASTLDTQDVDVMRDRIQNGTNLLADHCFQFDFLNDSFDDPKVPKALQEILNNPIKRQKLAIYINPPYAEHVSYGIKDKAGVAINTKVYAEFKDLVGMAGRELFVQFFLRIYKHISGSHIASFSTFKHIQGSNFTKFREYFYAEFKRGFIVPADSFDNVKGKFPIGFMIWNTAINQPIKRLECDVFNSKNKPLGIKTFIPPNKNELIIDWLRGFYDKKSERIAYLRLLGTDMQTNTQIFLTSQPSANDFLQHTLTNITKKNIIPVAIYLAVRHVFKATWLNDRDQFLFPNDDWKTDTEFQNNCLVYTLFHGQNKITSNSGTNHWIPFLPQEVDAKLDFDSHFMTDFMRGKLGTSSGWDRSPNDDAFFENEKISDFIPSSSLQFSLPAQAVFEVARGLYTYYHSQENVNVNASLYDIKEYFQGRNPTGRMNGKSDDNKYNAFIDNLKNSLELLEKQIQPKVYKYGFLK